MAGPKHNELPAVVVPQHLWLRSARPVQGKVVQWAVPLVFVAVGFMQGELSLRVGFVVLAILLFVSIPVMGISRLEQIGREVQAADRKRALELLKWVPERPVVRFFAPLGWTALQLALLNLKAGEGLAAANGFAETARLCQQPDAVMLVSAQAHAYVLAGDRTKARELLAKLTAANLLGPRDQLDLGIVLLIETKKFKQALSYVETARKTIGDHPLVLAAQALALQKIERIDEASEMLEQVQIAIKDQEPDPITDDLIKRARKGLQDFLEAQLRRERRARSRRTTIVVSSEAAASEIVSGEIAAGGEPTASETGLSTEPEGTRRFHQLDAVEEPEEPAPAPKPTPAREPDAPQPGLEIDLYSVPRTSAHTLPPAKKETPQPVKEEPRSRDDSVSAALSTVDIPAAGAAAPSDAPAAVRPEVAPKTESDVPTFRRRQTLLGVLPGEQGKAEPSRSPGPVEPSKPPAPSLPSLSNSPSAAPKTALPTRATRHEGNPLPAVPSTSMPTFRAPSTRGSDKGDEG